MDNRKEHWERIYRTSDTSTKSWYQKLPKVSLGFFEDYNVPQTARIIDIGGGDSFLVDHLLAKGYKNITVLDVSKAAIEKAKRRLGERACLVEWIVSDVTEFEPVTKYEVWHDRATFHFLTDDDAVQKYLEVARNNIVDKGFVFIGAFSIKGPGTCSGLKVRQYTDKTLSALFLSWFDIERCEYNDHITPSRDVQTFIYCHMRKK